MKQGALRNHLRTMNRIVHILLRMVGLRRPKPKTHLCRYLRLTEHTMLVLLCAYTALSFCPQVLFAHSISADGITLYARMPLPPEAAHSLTQAADLLRQSELAVPGRSERVFVCNSPWLFRLFNPRGSHGFGYAASTGNIFLASVDFAKNTARSQGAQFNTRSLPSVIAHEVTHGLIRHRVGMLRSLHLPDWIEEGYCEYVARESSFPETDGLRLVASGQEHPSMSFRYFLYRQMVAHLLDVKHLSFDELVVRGNDFTQVRQSLLKP